MKEVYLGDTFLEVASPDSHLWIVLSCPCENPGHVAIANITSWKDGKSLDSSCILKRGDHPFVKHKSHVSYRQACVTTVTNLKKGLHSAVLQSHRQVSEELLARVQAGALKSPFCQEGIKRLLRDQGFDRCDSDA